MGQVRPARDSWRRLVSQPPGLAWAHLLWLGKPQAGHGGTLGPRTAAGETLVFCPNYARGVCEPPSTVVGLGHGCESVVCRHYDVGERWAFRAARFAVFRFLLPAHGVDSALWTSKRSRWGRGTGRGCQPEGRPWGKKAVWSISLEEGRRPVGGRSVSSRGGFGGIDLALFGRNGSNGRNEAATRHMRLDDQPNSSPPPS